MFSIELLESRIAPAAVFVNATTATYTDAEGDFVTVKFTKPVLSGGNVDEVLSTVAAGVGEQLQMIDLTQALDPAGVGITITAKPTRSAGDGFASVGYLDAIGIDLGAVKIHGDLGRIDAGDGVGATLGVKSLTVVSIGFLGTSTQAAGGTLASNISGGIGAVHVATDWDDGSLTVTGGSKGRIAAIAIGDAINSGNISASGAIGPITAGGSIFGTSLTATNVGALSVGGALDSCTINVASIGSETVGGDFNGNSITTTGNAGAIKIDGFADSLMLSVGGGLTGFSVAHDFTNSAITANDLLGVGMRIGGDLDSTTLTVTGSSKAISVGGTMNEDAIAASSLTNVLVDGSVVGGSITANMATTITIGGNLDGSGTLGGAAITVAVVQTMAIHGSVIGGASSESGFVSCESVAALTIGGDIRGGGNPGSGAVTETGDIQGFSLGSVVVGGSVISGVNSGTGTLSESGAIQSDSTIGSLLVRGSLIGNSGANGTTPAIISSTGPTNDTTTDPAIGKLTIRGTVDFANILAGYDLGLNAMNADAQISAVTVGGDWIASNLVAGAENIASNNTNFGVGDVKIQGPTVNDNPAVFSRIGSISIAGEIIGVPGGPGHFGFVAEEIGAFSLGGVAIAAPGVGATRELGTTGDVTIERIE